MSQVNLEHVNITVSDPAATAAMLCDLFDWTVRWQGESMLGGHTYHVGTDDQYLAVYTYDGSPAIPDTGNSRIRGGLNHVGVLVDDLAKIEAKVIAAGFKPDNYGDYQPGRRFYFTDQDNIEYEVVSYS